MKIQVASQIDWAKAGGLRCPEQGCGLGVLPYGRSEPFVVTDAGEIYCRTHGARHHEHYQAQLDAYREARKGVRKVALAKLDAQAEEDNAAAEE